MKLFNGVFLSMVFFISSGVSQSLAAENVTVESSITYYDVSANSLEEFFKGISVDGPKSGRNNAWALIRWDLNTEYYFEKKNGKCRFNADSISVIAEIVLPNWANIDEQESHIQRWWQEFSDYIKNHEELHLDNAIEGSHQMAKVLDKMPFVEQCRQSRNQFIDIKHNTLSDIKKQDLLLDTKTMRDFNSGKPLFKYLKEFMPNVSIESGGMTSFIAF
jgi:predicted secreted Zn-dependent protease